MLMPEHGRIEEDATGDHIRCHICGEWFVSLATHVRLGHEMSAAEYRQEYGLNKRAPLLARSERERRRSAAPLLAKYHHLSRMSEPDFPRDGASGPRRAQHARALEEAQSRPEYRVKLSQGQKGKPKPYMAERNRAMAAKKRGEPKPPYMAGEERACVICGTTFRVKPSHPKRCCSAACRTERRRQLMPTERAKQVGRLGGRPSHAAIR